MKSQPSLLAQHLDELKLPYLIRHHADLARESAAGELIDAEPAPVAAERTAAGSGIPAKPLTEGIIKAEGMG